MTLKDLIKEKIYFRKLLPGEFIRQWKLAQEFSTSKTPIREALAELASEGFVEIEPNKGARVRELTTDEIKELFRVRKALELCAFDEAFPKLNDGHIQRAKFILSQLENNSDCKKIIQLEWLYISELLEPAEMSNLKLILERVHFLMATQFYQPPDSASLRNIIQNRKLFLDSCLTGNKDLAKALLKKDDIGFITNTNEHKQITRKKMGRKSTKWNFWIDRGGTFTDVVAKTPSGEIKTKKLLSNNPGQYADATIEAIRRFLGTGKTSKIPVGKIASIKMGTTVATNALLERKGESTVLVITKGFKNLLKIGYQNRSKLFDLNIILPSPVYSEVIEANERVDCDGRVLTEPDIGELKQSLQASFDKGFRSLAIVLMHSYKYPQHEKTIAKLAKETGFTQISVSHETEQLIKIVGRGDTAVVDAYLSPILNRYVDGIAKKVGKTNLLFMQSNGGLTSAGNFRGKDAILSGPAGGIVGMARIAELSGIERIIGFDMGGTSTDVSHYNGNYEYKYETVISGVRLRTPMMDIHTVAAGGGSILQYDGMRFRVGPESAGAVPGPTCYRMDGPLCVTDCNLMLGRIDPEFFPSVFGKNGNESLDAEAVKIKFSDLSRKTGKRVEEVAQGFLEIAVENMSNAIRSISVQRGYDITTYTLCCFGGAAGQHACLVAEKLGMTKVLCHQLAGVLSAYGMGFADIRTIRNHSVEAELSSNLPNRLEELYTELINSAKSELTGQGLKEDEITCERKLFVRYEGTNTDLPCSFDKPLKVREEFSKIHKRRFGFTIPGRKLLVSTISVEAYGGAEIIDENETAAGTRTENPKPVKTGKVFLKGNYHSTGFYMRSFLKLQDVIDGPAVILEDNSTIVVEPGWRAEITDKNQLLLHHTGRLKSETWMDSSKSDPIRLEIFNNLFMAIADQMGEILANTSYSVNIKERLDFSCAVFDRQASLIANAPHVPVHLGSMGKSVEAMIGKWGKEIQPGDSFVLNDPYDGGTHLPDITVITPVFVDREVMFYVASRGHHADVGGIKPGSMPPDSRHLEEEGVLFPNIRIMRDWKFLEDDMVEVLEGAKYPARNVLQNLEDLKAQIAANEKGVMELLKMVKEFGKNTVENYTRHVQNNAEESVRRIITNLCNNRFELVMDQGAKIRVEIREIGRASCRERVYAPV